MEPGCVFCAIVSQPASAELVHKDDLVTAFRDRFPQAPVHVLVVPNRHVSGVADLSEEDAPLVARMIAVANRIAAQEGLAQDGYRLVVNQGPAAGQSVFHLHLHLLGGRRLGPSPG
ncbi:MAG: histidine triad nucleotide-binding protein [Anaerolineae bacterium]